MYKQEKLLSICIPTYCRALYLHETLDSLSAALKGFKEEVEVIVSDNASTDNTAEILAKFQTRLPNFRRNRNNVNLGAELNFLQVLHLAKGKYIWILGDDDREDPRLIGALLEKLRSDCDMVIMNHSVHSKDFKITHKKAIHSVSVPEHYDGKDVILANFGPIIGFISCVVIKRNLLAKTSEEEFKKYSSYGLSFLYSVYACLPCNTTATFIQKPLLHCRGGNSVLAEYESYERIFIDGMAMVFDSLRELGYSQSAINLAKKKVIRMYLLQYIIKKKRDRTFSIKTFRKIHVGFSHCFPDYLRVIIYSITPRFLIEAAKSIQGMRCFHMASISR